MLRLHPADARSGGYRPGTSAGRALAGDEDSARGPHGDLGLLRHCRAVQHSPLAEAEDVPQRPRKLRPPTGAACRRGARQTEQRVGVHVGPTRQMTGYFDRLSAARRWEASISPRTRRTGPDWNPSEETVESSVNVLDRSLLRVNAGARPCRA